MHFDAFIPTRLFFGARRLGEAGPFVRACGSRALVVTSRTAMARLGFTERLLKSLASAGVAATVFCDMDITPTTVDVDRAASVAREFRADVVVGLGGGSALDCAKAVAAVAPGHAPCEEYLKPRGAKPDRKTLPIVAIPTTAGTGSEMNRSAIITNPDPLVKDAIRSDWLLPHVALVDPELTYDVPAEVTAQTGFDALAHAVESYVSPKSQPLADALAECAITNVVSWLPLAIADPRHAVARERLALASTSMGYNLTCVGTCLPHRLDKPVCAHYPAIAHGQAIAFFYPAWAEYSWRGAPEKFAKVAALLDPASLALPPQERASVCAKKLGSFISRVGLGRPMKSFGILPQDLKFFVRGVSGDLHANPVPVESDQVLSFYERALAANT